MWCGRGEALDCSRGIPGLNQWSIAEAVINRTHHPLFTIFRLFCGGFAPIYFFDLWCKDFVGAVILVRVRGDDGQRCVPAQRQVG